jgi:type IV secretion system protein VirB5
MNISKNILKLVFALTVMFSATQARAGIPTIDVANLVQSIQEVLAWGEQYKQMVESIKAYADQLKQAKTMTEKLDGLRNLGTILNDPNVFAMLPPEMRNTAHLLTQPASFSTDPAAIKQILGSFGLSTPTSGSSTLLDSYADAIGRAQQILASTNLRRAQIDRLALRVNTSVDAKDSLDLMNRNTVESSRINNDLIATIATIDASKQSIELKRLAYEKKFGTDMMQGASNPRYNFPF